MRNDYNLSSDELAAVREFAFGRSDVLLPKLGIYDGRISLTELGHGNANTGMRVLRKFLEFVRHDNVRQRRNTAMLRSLGFLVEPPTNH